MDHETEMTLVGIAITILVVGLVALLAWYGTGWVDRFTGWRADRRRRRELRRRRLEAYRRAARAVEEFTTSMAEFNATLMEATARMALFLESATREYPPKESSAKDLT